MAHSWLHTSVVLYHRGHDLTLTCVSLSKDGRVAYSASKDGSLYSWDVEGGGTRTSTFLSPLRRGGSGGGGGGINDNDASGNVNRREILSIAMSDDGRYHAVGGRDDRFRIFVVRILLSFSSLSSGGRGSSS
jgi:ribosomal RNA-processing protein 9